MITIQQGGTGEVAFAASSPIGSDLSVALKGTPSYDLVAKNYKFGPLPAGVTAPTETATPSAPSGTLSIDVSDSAAAGNYYLSVYAQDSYGNGTNQLLALTIVPVSGGLTLSFDPPEKLVLAGMTDSTILRIDRTGGFSGAIDLSIPTLPTGIAQASFSPTPVSKGVGSTSSFLDFGVQPNATGRYLVTAAAVPHGLPEQTAAFYVDVVSLSSAFALVVAEASTSVGQGGTTSASLRVVRGTSPAYTGAIAITVEGLPAGVTAVVNPMSIASPNEAATITFSADANAATGDYPLTIRASGPGSTDQTAPLTLSVLPNSFTIAVNPTLVSAPAGGMASAQVTATRNGFTDPIDLSVMSANGISGVFTPSTLNGTSTTSALALTIPATLATGDYSVTVQATSPLAATQTAPLTVRVCSGSCAVRIAAGLNSPIQFRQAGGNLFWMDSGADGGGIFSVAKGGGTPTLIVPGQSLFPLAVDAMHLYYGDQNTVSLRRCDQDGTGCIDLVHPSAPPAGEFTTQGNIALDDFYVYWGLAGYNFSGPTTQHETQIFIASKVAENVPATSVDDLRDPDGSDTSGVWVVADGQNVYFNDGMVKSVPRLGGTPALLATNASKPVGLWQDSKNLYWRANGTDSTFGTVPKDGSSQVVTFTLSWGPNPTFPRGVDVDDSGIYATVPNLVGKFDSSGTPTILDDNMGLRLNGEAVIDGTGVYWFANNLSGQPGSIEIWKAPK
jgi:hypothetical protein